MPSYTFREPRCHPAEEKKKLVKRSNASPVDEPVLRQKLPPLCEKRSRKAFLHAGVKLPQGCLTPFCFNGRSHLFAVCNTNYNVHPKEGSRNKCVLKKYFPVCRVRVCGRKRHFIRRFDAHHAGSSGLARGGVGGDPPSG